MRVRIYRPAKSAMQSGLATTKQWRIEAELETPRMPDPLMGWVSAGDTLNEIRMRFSSEEEAIRFATEAGWDYWVDSPQGRIVTPRNYADNFKEKRKS